MICVICCDGEAAAACPRCSETCCTDCLERHCEIKNAAECMFCGSRFSFSDDIVTASKRLSGLLTQSITAHHRNDLGNRVAELHTFQKCLEQFEDYKELKKELQHRTLEHLKENRDSYLRMKEADLALKDGLTQHATDICFESFPQFFTDVYRRLHSTAVETIRSRSIFVLQSLREDNLEMTSATFWNTVGLIDRSFAFANAFLQSEGIVLEFFESGKNKDAVTMFCNWTLAHFPHCTSQPSEYFPKCDLLKSVVHAVVAEYGLERSEPKLTSSTCVVCGHVINWEKEDFCPTCEKVYSYFYLVDVCSVDPKVACRVDDACNQRVASLEDEEYSGEDRDVIYDMCRAYVRERNAVCCLQDEFHTSVLFHTTEIERLEAEIRTVMQNGYRHGNSLALADLPPFSVIACSACNGFVNLQADKRCICCQSRHCEKCWELSDPEHACSEEAVRLVEDRKKHTQCPTCRACIERSEGCDTMFCTVCRTGFTFDGKVINSPVVFNPHFFEDRDAGPEFEYRVHPPLLLDHFIELNPGPLVSTAAHDYCVLRQSLLDYLLHTVLSGSEKVHWLYSWIHSLDQYANVLYTSIKNSTKEVLYSTTVRLQSVIIDCCKEVVQLRQRTLLPKEDVDELDVMFRECLTEKLMDWIVG